MVTETQNDVTLPTIGVVRGHRPGPTIGLLGGVHGNEIEGVLAVHEVVRRLTGSGFAGELRWAAPAHPAAWNAGQRADPRTGRDLARAFPGRPDRAGAEAVAHHLTSGLIDGADLLIDLHTAGSESEMPRLCGFLATGPTAPRAGTAAMAFAAPFTWLHDELGPGRSLTAAAELGVPAIYAECSGGRRVSADDWRAYVDGVLRVCRDVGMIDVAPDPKAATVVVRGDGDLSHGTTASAAGVLVSSAVPGQQVRQGEVIATIVTDDGRTIEELPAAGDSFVMLLRRTVRVMPNDVVYVLARPDAGRSSPSGGLRHSDAERQPTG